MSRSRLLLMAAASIAAGAFGCAHCDTCDDFPAPCNGANCGYQAPEGVPYPVGPAVPVGPASGRVITTAPNAPPPESGGPSAFNAGEPTSPPDSPSTSGMPK